MEFELIAAASRGDVAESKRLIEACDVSIDATDAMGQTPLHVSALQRPTSRAFHVVALTLAVTILCVCVLGC